MFGILLGILKNFIWVGYSIVESLLFMWVFNYTAPFMVEYGLPLPFVSITWKLSLCLFLLIGFAGNWIKSLVPTLINIDNTKTTKEK